MANDIDLWQDIEQLERLGRKQEAKDLLEVFHFRYIERNESKLKKAIEKFEKKYHYDPL